MSGISYLDAFALDQESGGCPHICAGEIVRAGVNAHPQFVVIAVHGDKAWLRNTSNGVDSVAPLERLQRAESPLAVAAE